MTANLLPNFSLQNLFFLENHEDCRECQQNNWTPSATGRRHLHRHNEKTTRTTDLMDQQLREFCRQFPTDCDGQNFLWAAGLAVFEMVQAAAKEKNLPFLVLLEQLGLARYLSHVRQAGLQYLLDAQNHLASNSALPNPQENSQPPLPEAVAPSESSSEVPPPAPTVWDQLKEPLIKRVNEQNFEIWLSPLVFVGAVGSQMVLGCPNQVFYDTLTANYTEVIQEELHKISELKEVVFQVIERKEEPPKEEPPQEILPKPEFASPLLSKIARREAARDELKERCYARVHGRLVLMMFEYQNRLKFLEQREAEEDRLEALRAQAARVEAIRDQRAKPSYFWPSGKATPKRLQRLVEQLDKDSS